MKTILAKRIRFGYLTGLEVRTETLLFSTRVTVNWSFHKIQPGSSMWQTYKK